MRHIGIAILAFMLASCAGLTTSDLQCGDEICDASIEQTHQGSADWYIWTSSECATVETPDGAKVPICGHERLAGAITEIKARSCRVCVRKKRS